MTCCMGELLRLTAMYSCCVISLEDSTVAAVICSHFDGVLLVFILKISPFLFYFLFHFNYYSSPNFFYVILSLSAFVRVLHFSTVQKFISIDLLINMTWGFSVQPAYYCGTYILAICDINDSWSQHGSCLTRLRVKLWTMNMLAFWWVKALVVILPSLQLSMYMITSLRFVFQVSYWTVLICFFLFTRHF